MKYTLIYSSTCWTNGRVKKKRRDDKNTFLQSSQRIKNEGTAGKWEIKISIQ
jgi:hypothetical protein